MVIIQIVCAATGEPTVHAGAYVKSYDPEAYNGLGRLVTTNVPRDALRFNTAAEAFETWKSQSTTAPTRDDGKPNRPMTAYSIEVVPLDARLWRK